MSKPVHSDDLVTRKGLYYQKSSDVPFTGRVIGTIRGKIKKGKFDGDIRVYYPNTRKIYYDGNYKDGDRNGGWVMYYVNGQIMTAIDFKDGKKDGKSISFHKNGKLMDEGTFKDDKEDGPWVTYHENGQLHSKGTYKDGEYDGPWVSFESDGTVDKKWTGTYKNGKKIEPNVVLSETVKSETVKFWDLVERKGLYYQKSSDVPFTGTSTGKEQWKIKKGKIEGPWVIYHDNGQLWYKGTFKDGNEEGPWVEYHDNGQLGEKGNYKDGKKDGPWVSYHENGQLRYKEILKDGKPDGPHVSYYDNGQLEYKGTYKDGKEDGPWVSFKSDGTVNKKWTGTYKNGKKISD